MEPADVFKEWDVYAKQQRLLSRDLDFDGIIRNSEQKIVTLTGIRRAGKSSILMLLAQRLVSENVCYINLEDSRIKNIKDILDDAIRWFGDTGYMLLDEVNSAHDWEGWLARTHGMLKGKLRLIVTSSRRSLMQPSRPLRGRILPYELYPLPFLEFLDFKGIPIGKTTAGKGRVGKAFSEYLKYGGFPEIALTEKKTDKVLILNAYFRDIVGLDIAEASGQEITTVETFGRYVIQSPYFSASKCLNFLKSVGHKIGKEKILQLEHYSQLSYLFFFVPIFSYNIKDKSQYPRKAYCGDTGFAYAVTGKTELGRLFENLVFLELKRRLQGIKEICYWKDKDGLETDFVIRQGTNVSEVIQVCYDLSDEKTREREVKGLVACAKELKASRATILSGETAESRTVEGVRIAFVPLVEWLLERGETKL